MLVQHILRIFNSPVPFGRGDRLLPGGGGSCAALLMLPGGGRVSLVASPSCSAQVSAGPSLASLPYLSPPFTQYRLITCRIPWRKWKTREDRAFVSLLSFAFYFSGMAFETSQAETEAVNKPPEEADYLYIVTARKTPPTCMVPSPINSRR